MNQRRPGFPKTSQLLHHRMPAPLAARPGSHPHSTPHPCTPQWGACSAAWGKAVGGAGGAGCILHSTHPRCSCCSQAAWAELCISEGVHKSAVLDPSLRTRPRKRSPQVPLPGPAPAPQFAPVARCSDVHSSRPKLFPDLIAVSPCISMKGKRRLQTPQGGSRYTAGITSCWECC